MTEARPDDVVLAGILRRVFADAGAYAELAGDPHHLDRGLGLSIEATMDLSPEEWDAVTNAWGWEAHPAEPFRWRRAELADPPGVS